jgi:hypothetical protein
MRESILSHQAAMRAAAQASQSGEFFAALDVLLRLQCAVILGLPSGDAVTAQVVESGLVPKGLDLDSAEALRRLFAAVDAAKFAPAAESAELSQLRESADAVVKAIQVLEGGRR